MRKYSVWLYVSLILLVLVVGIVFWQKATNIPGYTKLGVIYRDYSESLLVEPLAVNEKPFYVRVSDREKYATDSYKLYELPEYKGAIKYMMGYFWGWESITSTPDKRMLVKDGSFGKTYKIRVAFAKSEEWKGNETSIVMIDSPEKREDIRRYVSDISDIELKKILKIGTKVVIWPGYFVPEIVKMDDDSTIWISNLVLRK